jgi:spore coat polysaccharide biosynthesis predicted glycosyltransferase SpsG
MPGARTPFILNTKSSLVVVSFVQGGRKQGLGHIYRIAAVISELDKLGVKVDICFDGDEFGAYHLKILGRNITPLENFQDIEKIDILIIDGVSVSSPYSDLLKKSKRIVLLSPVFDRPELVTEAYIRINPENLLISNAFVGRIWSVIFQSSVQVISENKNPLSLGISLSGGISPYLAEVLSVVGELPNIRNLIAVLKVAIGGHSFNEVERLLSNIVPTGIDLVLVKGHGNIISSLEPLDIVICGDGITVDQTCHAGIPCIVYSDFSKRYKVLDLIESQAIYFASHPQELSLVLMELLISKEKRDKLSHEAFLKVDGKGAERIAKKIFPPE